MNFTLGLTSSLPSRDAGDADAATGDFALSMDETEVQLSDDELFCADDVTLGVDDFNEGEEKVELSVNFTAITKTSNMTRNRKNRSAYRGGWVKKETFKYMYKKCQNTK